nr:MAG TPA: hypothetical protein [Caudoviricetes sp.]
MHGHVSTLASPVTDFASLSANSKVAAQSFWYLPVVKPFFSVSPSSGLMLLQLAR